MPENLVSVPFCQLVVLTDEPQIGENAGLEKLKIN
jgi:hypothetical protein